MDWIVFLTESIENWWTTTGGIATVIGIITGALGTIAGIVTKMINDFRRENHSCPKHCITKKPLKPKKKKEDGKSKA